MARVTTVAAGAATLLTMDRPTFNRTLRHHPCTLLLPATLRQALWRPQRARTAEVGPLTLTLTLTLTRVAAGVGWVP